MDWETILSRSIQNYSIRELYLYQFKVLRTCNNWLAVKEVGRVDFKGKHADYNGGIVKYAEKFYFVPDSILQVLTTYRKWNFTKTIKVVREEDHLKKQQANKMYMDIKDSD